MLSSLLRPGSDALLTDARRVLGDLRDAIVRFDGAPDDRATLIRSIDQLDELFLLVVVGEFNAGKSAFINALIGPLPGIRDGTAIVREGVTPTTATLQLIRFGDTLTEQLRPDGTFVIAAPVPWLRDVHIVDTPGTNAIVREHERLTTEFVPRADLVLFVTSAERPFTETERAFMATIRGWGKKIVIVLNKIDIFDREDDLRAVTAFVEEAATRLLGVTPEIFPVSARLAQRAKRGEPALWAASRFEALETYVTQTLDAEGRFALKLANPLGVGEVLAARYARIADERLALLQDDITLLSATDRQLAVYRDDLQRGFELRMDAIEKTLAEMELRGQRYFEDTLRLARVADLLNRARVQKEFEDRVVADTPATIERQVTALIDWLVEQELAQWQAIQGHLAARPRPETATAPFGAPDVGTFHADRAQLMASIGREAQRVVDTYDRQAESAAMADQARVAVTTAAAVGAGAVGLGTLVTIAATTAAADVTGLLMASALAALGLLVIPARRRRATTQMREKLRELRVTLETTLRREFTLAQQRGGERMAATLAPYRRFVTAEQARWREAAEQLAARREACGKLKERVAGRGDGQPV